MIPRRAAPGPAPHAARELHAGGQVAVSWRGPTRPQSCGWRRRSEGPEQDGRHIVGRTKHTDQLRDVDKITDPK